MLFQVYKERHSAVQLQLMYVKSDHSVSFKAFSCHLLKGSQEKGGIVYCVIIMVSSLQNGQSGVQNLQLLPTTQ